MVMGMIRARVAFLADHPGFYDRVVPLFQDGGIVRARGRVRGTGKGTGTDSHSDRGTGRGSGKGTGRDRDRD